MAVNASAEQQQALLDVQAIDTKLLQLEHRRKGIAEVQQAHDLEVQLGSIDMKIVAAITEVSDLDLDRAKAEADVEQVVNRANRDKERMDSGSVSAKDLSGLQSELESLAKRQSELEDVELEIMQNLEEARASHEALKVQRESVEAELRDVEGKRDEQLNQLAAQEQELNEQKKSVAAGLPADLVALYDKVREDQGGVGAALLQHGECKGCHIALDSDELNRIRNLASEVVVRCEQCRRILIRTAESGL